jgi:pimeloyl-ACP methyl ester carboxylesterase
MEGSMYVEHFKPVEVRHPYPVVMIHGGGQTGTNFTGTPDGRRGWAHDFLRAGYEVYVVDQPGRARSGQFEDAYGPVSRNATSRIEQRFTAPRDFKLWPQAERHTQWPGSGRKGDPVFDQFYASQVASISSGDKIEELNQAAGAALLDRIGPAVVMVHSQSGPFGWLWPTPGRSSSRASSASSPAARPSASSISRVRRTGSATGTSRCGPGVWPGCR